MRVTEVTYERLFPSKREQYANERLSATVTISGRESVDDAINLAKRTVITASTRFQEYLKLRVAAEQRTVEELRKEEEALGLKEFKL